MYVEYTVTYKSGTPAPNQMFLAWGCHIAVGYDGAVRSGGIDDDWGLGLGAGSISGGSYHCKNVSWLPDGNIGSQDNQIMSASVIAPGFKSGYKFNDLDNDGVKDAGEPGLGEWVINVTGMTDEDVAVSKTFTTLADGYYELLLDPGTYTVFETLKPGWSQTRPFTGMTPPAGETIVTAMNGTKGYQFAMAEAQDRSTNDFGNASLGNLKVEKVVSPTPPIGDPWLTYQFSFSATGPEAYLYNFLLSHGQNELMNNLGTGTTYAVSEAYVVDAPCKSIVVTNGSGTVIQTITDPTVVDGKYVVNNVPVEVGKTTVVTFTNVPTISHPSITGHKFIDDEGDGSILGDAPYAGWPITLYYDKGLIGTFEPLIDEVAATTVTNAGGTFVFPSTLNLPGDRDYLVVEGG